MTHPTLKDAARALCEESGYDPDHLEPGSDPYMNNTEVVDGYNRKDEPCHFFWRHFEARARAVLLSIRPPDREDLPLRQLEARDYIDGILNG